MSANEWNISYANHIIRIVKSKLDGARLFVDDELLDTTNDLYESEDEATLVGMFGENEAVVEVFVRQRSRISVRVNGEWVTGERTLAVASD